MSSVRDSNLPSPKTNDNMLLLWLALSHALVPAPSARWIGRAPKVIAAQRPTMVMRVRRTARYVRHAIRDHQHLVEAALGLAALMVLLRFPPAISDEAIIINTLTWSSL